MEVKIKDIIKKYKDEFILFNMLDESEIENIVPYLAIEDYLQGSVLYNEGDEGNYIGFIIQGELEVKKETEFKGKQIVIAILGEGSFVGELALVDAKRRRNATVAVRQNVELVTLNRASLEIIVEKYPRIAIKILKGLNQIMAIRMRKAVDRLASIF
ncbi:MAG: cyclic nucleotide-binding domain-containing protein [Nitrospira sp.]|nr:cyclic nucleotide-binding domain-containing protein [bacterium]MBL7048868.1 cyclic nucleotide-binding domain-containing protein [Nitrospira sp.]